jgi:ribonuclease HII
MSPRGARGSTCTLEIETTARVQGYAVVAGVDEVGRGALFGPVMAGAVVLGQGFDPGGIDDSKRLSARRREAEAARIQATAHAWCVGSAAVDEIEREGIQRATRLAMLRAIEGLTPRADLLLVDGYAVPLLPATQWPFVKGDTRSVSIAAAAIVAKVARDALMRELDATYPGYGIGRNMGYGSLEHRQALAVLGLTPLHRRSFCHPQLDLFESEDTGSERGARPQRAHRGDELR